MEVILLAKVKGLGQLGDTVNVKNGYGRNFLVPTGKAVSATTKNIALFEERRVELEKAAQDTQQTANTLKEQIEALDLSIACKAADEGKLFGSVNSKMIAEALNNAGVEINKNQVRLDSASIRETGSYSVTIHLQVDIDATLNITVVAED